MNNPNNPSRCYRPRHFLLEEVVPKSIFDEYGGDSWRFLDSRILYTADCIREYLGVGLICNTWKWSGSSQYRGFRPSDCIVGAKNSGHKRGCCLDLIPKIGNVEDMRLKIIENNLIFPYLTEIEVDVSWLHIGCSNLMPLNGQSIRMYKP